MHADLHIWYWESAYPSFSVGGSGLIGTEHNGDYSDLNWSPSIEQAVVAHTGVQPPYGHKMMR